MSALPHDCRLLRRGWTCWVDHPSDPSPEQPLGGLVTTVYRTPADSPHEDERLLWAALLAGELPRDAGRRLNMPPKRVWYLCLKWADKNVYEYGVTCDLGWPTPSGARQEPS